MNNRILWLDNLKGLLLILTCCSHFNIKHSFAEPFLSYTSTYYVPMFFVASGFLSKSNIESWKDIVIKKTKSLLIPYFFFSIIALLHSNSTSLLGDLKQFLYTGSSCGIATPMWFVATLYVINLSCAPIIASCKNKKYLFVVLLLLLFLWCIIRGKHFDAPWHLMSIPFYGSLYIGGYLIKEYTPKHSSNFIDIILFITVALGGVGFIIDIKDSLLSFFCPLFIFYFVFCLSIRIKRWYVVDRKLLTYVSFNGIIILGFHNFIFRYWHFAAKHLNLITESSSVNFCISFIVVISTLYLLIIPFSNNFLFYIFNRKKISWMNNYLRI